MAFPLAREVVQMAFLDDNDSHQSRGAMLEPMVSLESILEQAAEAIIAVNRGGEVIYLNPAAKKFAAEGAEIAPGRSLDDVWPEIHDPEGAPIPREQRPWQQALRGETSTAREMRITRGQGSHLDLLFSAGPLYQRDGSRIGAVVTFADLTPQKPLEARLKHHDMFRLTLEAYHMGAWEWDVETGKIYWSDGIYPLLGLKQGEVEPSWDIWRQQTDHDDFLLAQKRLAKILQEPTEFRNEYRITLPDGKVRWIDTRGRSEQIGGKIKRLFGVAIDIQPQKELEQLLRSEKERQEQLASALSGDLCDPLMVIQGHAELALLALPADSTVRDNLQTILKSVDQMGKMIEDLTTVARIDSGQVQPVYQRLEIGSLLKDLLRRQQAIYDTGRLQLETPDDPCHTEADPLLLEKIIDILVSNGLKFSPSAQPVRIRLEPDADQVLITVADQGIGIPPDDYARLFTRYFRTQRAREIDGLGLGLYIAQKLAQIQSGQIRVSSQKDGEGSVFSVCLPRR